MWVLGGECEMCTEEATLGSSYQLWNCRFLQFPPPLSVVQRFLTAIVPAIIRDHEHDLPFEDVVVHQPATDARYVFVALHLFELTAQEPCGC